MRLWLGCLIAVQADLCHLAGDVLTTVARKVAK